MKLTYRGISYSLNDKAIALVPNSHPLRYRGIAYSTGEAELSAPIRTTTQLRFRGIAYSRPQFASI
ncbi:DUF4278 domain-containing protein [Leptolyngbya ohadii]|uniref:DUF4278 domain-containing protein n=1 Tax=Leptolyngbya ohadii TaxID=1962290 RepID=UPI000B59863D|nr:DUF4278 domain-containing protein [Leptolyngbya ohadii]